MAQDLRTKSDPQLINIATLMTGASAAYPFNAALKARLDAGYKALAAADLEFDELERAFRVAGDARRDLRAALLAEVASAAKMAEGDAALDDPALRAIGLQPRTASGRRPRTPPIPTDLVAKPDAFSGTVTARWKASAPRMQYVVETSTDGFEFSPASTVTRQSFTTPWTPGAPLWVRVRAQNAGMVSQPTPAVSVYAPSPVLRVEDGGLKAA